MDTLDAMQGTRIVLTFAPFPLLIGILILVLLLIILWRRGHNLVYLFFFSIFWMYLLILVSVTIFPIPLDGDHKFNNFRELIFQMQRVRAINLIPLYFGTCWELPCPCAFGIYQNILMTVPFGFGFSFIVRLKSRDFLWLSVAVGLVIEITQFVLDLVIGGAYRTVDVNDVLFNAIGVLLGYGVFRIFAWLYLIITHRLGINHAGLLAYIHDVANQAQTTSRAMPKHV